jgi:hypothetical protein
LEAWWQSRPKKARRVASAMASIAAKVARLRPVAIIMG